METINQFGNQSPPSQELEGAHIRRSERGILQMELDAPLIRQFTAPEGKTVYPKGVKLRFFNDDRTLKTTLEARYAVSFDDKEVMMARDSVVVVDYSNGDTIYLQDIFWNSAEDRIYSNHLVHAVNGSQETYGDGFVSDQRLNNIRILHQRGTIEFEE